MLPTPSAAAAQLRAEAARLARLLPQGNTLPSELWEARHRVLLGLLWLHVPALFAFGLWSRLPVEHLLGEMATLAVFAGLAMVPALSRTARASVASLGLLTCSALLVHFSGGYIEMHFHFFVMIIAISLYQEWAPFLLAVAYVVLHHGIVGVLDPTAVYNHADAWANPWKWALIHGVFVLAASGAALVNWRLNEIHRAEAREAAQRLHAVVSGAPVVLFATDHQGQVVFVDGRSEELLGKPRAEIVGKPFRATFGIPAPDTGLRTFTLGDRTLEVRVIERTGEAALPGQRIGVATDVTERVQAEAKERQAQQKLLEGLRETDRLKTSMLNIAAHELNTPLTPLRLQLQILQMGPFADPGQKRNLAILERNLDRLARLVNDILVVARMQAGRLTVERRALDLYPLVAEVVETFQPAAREARLALRYQGQGPLMVEGDRARLAQVLFNLLSNALKFTPAEGRVDVESAVEQGEVVLRVRDTGAGIDAADLPKLFQPFGQVHDTMEHSRPGSGLGLFISKGIVELHGGRLHAESRGKGHGTTFTLALPVPAWAGPSPETAPRPPPAERLQSPPAASFPSAPAPAVGGPAMPPA